VGSFRLTKRTTIAVGDRFAAGVWPTAAHLRERLCEAHGVTPDIHESRKKSAGAIRLGLLDDPLVAGEMRRLRAGRAEKNLGSEGYLLRMAEDGVVIAGAEVRGLFYGVQTFLQMIERQGRSLAVPCGRTIDQPVHPFRGVHLYIPPRREIPYVKRLIRYLASCKINTIILEVGAAMEFKRHPEINAAWERFTETVRSYPFGPAAMQNYNTLHTRGKDSIHQEQGGGSTLSQAEVRELLQWARAHHVRVVPEVQCPGHAYWLCLAHPEIAEWQDDKYPDTFCPSNPQSYELLFDAMEEVIEVFEPEWVSTGNDEYYFYSICPRCRNRSGHDLLAGHLNKVNDFLRERGIRHMIFADKLINPDETKSPRRKEWGTGRMIQWGGGKRVLEDAAGSYTQKPTWKAIDRIPDDILMLDWYYMLAPDTERYFAKHNKQVAFGNFEPFAFGTHRKRLYAPNVLGGEISTWIENGHLSHAHENWPLMAAIAADMFWSDVYRTTDPRDRTDVFAEFWRRNRDALERDEDRRPTRRPEPCTFKTVRLPPAPAASLQDAAPVRVSRSAYPVPFRIVAPPLEIPTGETAGVAVPVGRGVRSVVLLYGVRVQADEVGLPPLYEYGDYAEYFLSREIGALEVRAEPAVPHLRQPERTGRIPLRLGLEIGSLTEPYGLTAVSRPSFCDGILQPDRTAVYAFEWIHPNSGNMIIKEITLKRGRADIPGPILLYAVTLVL
jgi:hypothetical protein